MMVGRDLRNLPPDYDATELVERLKEVDVIVAQYPDDVRTIIKGEGTLAGVAPSKNETPQGLVIGVANASQTEMLMAALGLIADDQMDDLVIRNLGRMLADVSARGEPH